jgi:hypothetical protein
MRAREARRAFAAECAQRRTPGMGRTALGQAVGPGDGPKAMMSEVRLSHSADKKRRTAGRQ